MLVSKTKEGVASNVRFAFALLPIKDSDSKSLAEIECKPGVSCEKSFSEKLYLPSLLVIADPIIFSLKYKFIV